MSKPIVEFPVFDCQSNEWRIVNLATGTINATSFPSELLAFGVALAGSTDGRGDVRVLTGDVVNGMVLSRVIPKGE